MKQLFLLIFICISASSFSQIIKKDIFCSFEFRSPYRLERYTLSRVANYLTDSLNDRKILNGMVKSALLVDVIAIMHDRGWQLVNSTSYPSTGNIEGYVVYVYKKQVSYTEEMLRQGREALQEDAKKYKYYPD